MEFLNICCIAYPQFAEKSACTVKKIVVSSSLCNENQADNLKLKELVGKAAWRGKETESVYSYWKASLG